VGELVEPAISAEMVVERLREDERVGDQGSTGVVAHEQDGPRRDVLETADFAAKVEPGPCPDGRHRLAYVLRVARVDQITRALTEHSQDVGRAGDVGQRDPQHPGGTAKWIARAIEGAIDQRAGHSHTPTR